MSDRKVHAGDWVTIPKGAALKSMHPQRRGGYVSGRSFRVRIWHVFEDGTVNWAGSGGYWCWCPQEAVIRDTS